MSGYTCLGAGLWDWEPWVNLPSLESKMLWLALYTSPQAKRILPGLWHGGISMMAEASRLDRDQVLAALDTLIAHDMAEYDPKSRVLRLCGPQGHTPLPDALEEPHSPKTIQSWWWKFQSVPACGVRDAHVATLWWLIEHGTKMRALKKTTAKDRQKEETVLRAKRDLWQDTFGTIPIPAARKRGTRGLLDHDTSNSVQGSLFAPKALPADPQQAAAFLIPEPLRLQAGAIPVDKSVDNSSGYRIRQEVGPIRSPIRDLNNFTVPDTVSIPLGEGIQRSEISFSSSSQISDPNLKPPERSLASHTTDHGAEPMVYMVMTAKEVLQAICEGAGENLPLVFTESALASLERAISGQTRISAGVSELNALGRFLCANKQAAPGWVSWIARGRLQDAVEAAVQWEREIATGTSSTGVLH